MAEKRTGHTLKELRAVGPDELRAVAEARKAASMPKTVPALLSYTEGLRRKVCEDRASYATIDAADRLPEIWDCMRALGGTVPPVPAILKGDTLVAAALFLRSGDFSRVLNAEDVKGALDTVVNWCCERGVAATRGPATSVAKPRSKQSEVDSLLRTLAHQGSIPTGGAASLSGWADVLEKATGNRPAESTIQGTDFWRESGKRRGPGTGPPVVSLAEEHITGRGGATVPKSLLVTDEIRDEVEEQAVKAVMDSSLDKETKAQLIAEVRSGERTAAAVQQVLRLWREQARDAEAPPLAGEPSGPPSPWKRGRPKRFQHSQREKRL